MFHTSALVVRRLVRIEASRQKPFGLVWCHPSINRKAVEPVAMTARPSLIEAASDLKDPPQSQSMRRRGGYKLGAYSFT